MFITYYPIKWQICNLSFDDTLFDNGNFKISNKSVITHNDSHNEILNLLKSGEVYSSIRTPSSGAIFKKL
jgi:hypothetical protein